MVGILQPLAKEFSIVDENGKPTEYFIRWAQQRQIDISQGISEADLIAYLNAHPIQAGNGIDVIPSGSLVDSPTISLDAGLDDLNDVDLTTPPTDGQALIYDSGTGMWVPDDVSGGLAVEDDGTPVVTTATTLNFTGSGVTVTDAGGGQANIAISAGAPAALTYWVVHDAGTGSSQNVTLPYSVTNEEDINVYVNGVHYETDEYTVSGTTLTLTTNASGDSIEVRGEIVSGGGGSGGSGWTVLHNAAIPNPSANIDVSVAGYKNVLCIARLVTTSSSGNREISVSTDGGATFRTASGDYVIFADAGSESNTTGIIGHGTATTAARTIAGDILGIDLSGTMKLAREIGGGRQRLFVQSTDPITDIRLRSTAGNMTGGTLLVMGQS